MRKVILLIAFISSTYTIDAQTLIPRAGISLASVAMKQDNQASAQNSGSVTGLAAGLAVNLPVNTLGKFLFSVQPEITYIRKGFTNETTGEFQIGEAYYNFVAKNEFKLNYLEFPVLAKFEFVVSDLKVAFLAGPSVAFGLGGKYSSESRVDTGEGVSVYKSDGKIVFYDANGEDGKTSFDHNVDFGAQAGVALTFKNRICIDARYGSSFTNFIHDSKSKNQVFQFTVGVPITI